MLLCCRNRCGQETDVLDDAHRGRCAGRCADRRRAALPGLRSRSRCGRALGPSFSVTVADPTLGRPVRRCARLRHRRGGAAAVRDASAFGRQVAAEAQPILDMVVTDSRLDDARAAGLPDLRRRGRAGRAVRPHDRERPADRGARRRQGERRRVRRPRRGFLSCSAARARRRDRVFTGAASRRMPRRRHAELADGDASRRGCSSPPTARARRSANAPASPRTAGATASRRSSPRSRMNATIDGRAEEHFLPAGPFAILPLKERRSSIVWTEAAREAERIMALPDAGFHAELERRFKLHLGEITAVGAAPRAIRSAFWSRARSSPSGSRSSAMPPMSSIRSPGQGLNMGLKDVAALAEVIVDAARLGLDPGAPDVLERYQRWRRFDTMSMGLATDGLNRLFSNQSDVLRLVRDVGLGLVDRVPALKRPVHPRSCRPRRRRAEAAARRSAVSASISADGVRAHRGDRSRRLGDRAGADLRARWAKGRAVGARRRQCRASGEGAREPLSTGRPARRRHCARRRIWSRPRAPTPCCSLCRHRRCARSQRRWRRSSGRARRSSSVPKASNAAPESS